MDVGGIYIPLISRCMDGTVRAGYLHEFEAKWLGKGCGSAGLKKPSSAPRLLRRRLSVRTRSHKPVSHRLDIAQKTETIRSGKFGAVL